VSCNGKLNNKTENKQMIKAPRFSESTSPNQRHILTFSSYIRQTIKPYICSIIPIERLNESICIYERQCISNFSSKVPMYPCFAQKTMDIQSKSKDAMYLTQ
jgi:hypothetical protein